MVNVKRKLVAWAGAAFLQPIYERITFILLRLMNYGSANHPKDSGEFNLLRRLERQYFSDSSITIFDVGANVGQFAVGAAGIFPKSMIHCFEPSFSTFKKLQAKSTDRITVNQAGLGSSKGSFLLFEGQGRSVKASMIQHHESQRGEPVEVWTLDEYCMTRGINAIQLLKIDVEGFELEVLKGATRMISDGKIQFIQFEFGGINHVKQKVFLHNFFEFLPQYSLYRVLQRGLAELKYKPFYEVYLTSNYLAVLKTVNQQHLKS